MPRADTPAVMRALRFEPLTLLAEALSSRCDRAKVAGLGDFLGGDLDRSRVREHRTEMRDLHTPMRVRRRK